MLVAGLLGRVDVKATSTGSGGITALPRAVRHGAALGIAALYPKTVEPLRLAGLLTLDPRKKERCKVNQPGARAKWIWYVFASLRLQFMFFVTGLSAFIFKFLYSIFTSNCDPFKIEMDPFQTKLETFQIKLDTLLS
ncbi:unnamed protein product [Heligmosomoides polygyrus]|uniref:Uncharacterized protein n=1 Tax=Heligmosomoides polygyrus TaxID=6339 RepID=A0A183FEP3_HELPZ|nr:unnamed protein product [Heligmosomoides polygyrus]